MPQSTLVRERVLSLLPVPVSDPQLDDLLFASKAEVEHRDPDALGISVTPDRLDLLSEGGLALYLQGALEVARGLPPIPAMGASAPVTEFVVDASVDRIRRWIGGFVVRAPADAGIDAGTLAEAIRFQEILHDSLGRDRRAASLGIYPLDRLETPIHYGLEPLADVRFVPLDGSEEIGAERFFADHPMAMRFGALGREGDRCLTLRDVRGTVLSLPPILNGREGGEARVGDRTLLIESTGTRPQSVRESLGLLLVVFAARGWSFAPVAIRRAGNPAEEYVVARPAVALTAAEVHDVAGVALPAGEIERRLGRCRLSARPHAGGWTVESPPWRPDLLAPIDLVEEVVLAVPLRPGDGRIPPSTTRGRRRHETTFRRQIATALLGLGCAAPHTSVLASEAAVARLPGSRAVRLANPVSAEYAVLRDRLLVSHLEVLGRNTRHGYPQRYGEVGPVIVADPAAESGADTRYRAGLLLASETAGFADAAGAADYLLRTVDVVAVREPAELPGTIPGRAARARVAGEVVAEMGEIHPRLLSELGVPVPVAWAELDLTNLYVLAGRRDTA